VFFEGALLKNEGSIAKESFGRTPEGRKVDLYTLRNASGMQATIINYGGVVVSLNVPGGPDAPVDVVSGCPDLDGYLTESPHFGAIIGRYGNRIARATFSLNGIRYLLAKNNGDNSLHGGRKGFDKVLWDARDASAGGVHSLELTYLSKDGEEGFPGNLAAKVTYTVTPDNEFRIDYHAVTDQDTVVNLTNHSYFNLAGQGNGDVLGHEVMIDADRFTPVDAGLIPTGQLQPVAGTVFDFRKPVAIGSRIATDDEQLKLGAGYDHNFVLNHDQGSLGLAAMVSEPRSGRVLEVLTTEPGVQFYTGNHLRASVRGKAGKTYQPRFAFCLETQHFPDSPNQSAFPSTVLKPGEEFSSTTVYRFPASERP
jgi:aldose 1-epimerase